MPRTTLQLLGDVPAGNGLLVNAFVLPESTGLFVPGLGEPGLGEEGTITHGLQLVGDVNVDLEGQAQPSAGVTQRPGLIIEQNGVALSLDDVCANWTIDRTLDRVTTAFNFSVPVVDGVSALGDPFTKRAPSAGLDEIDVYGAYKTPGGETVRTILITDGIVDRAPRSGNPKNGYVEDVSGTDSVGRILTTVTRIFPVGHGLPRGRVVRALLEEAGETMFRLEDGGRMYKEIQAVDADPLALCQEILDAEGRRLLKDPEGYWINPLLGPPTQDATWTITEENILATAEVSVDFPGDPVTDVTMTGSEQIARDDEGDSPCGITSKVRTIEISSDYSPVVADHQETDGSITVNSQDAARNMVVSRVTTVRELYCGILKRQKQTVEGWFNPQSIRYKWGSGGSLNVRSYLSRPVDPGSAMDDTSPAFLYSKERFLTLAETETWYFYDRQGFSDIWPADYISGGTVFGPYYDIYNHLIQPSLNPHTDTGRKLGEMTIKRAFYGRRDAVKAFQAGKIWPETDYIGDRYTFGDGDGGGNGAQPFGETFQDISAEFLLIESNDQNQVTREKIYRKAFVRPQGNAYWYEGDIESSLAREVYQLSGTEETFYDQAEEGFHDETTVRFDGNGRFIDQQAETGIEGALPAVDLIPTGDEADSTLYADAEEQEQLAKEARYGETRTIKVQVISDFLELHHPKNQVKTSLAYAENVEELVKAAELLIDESSAGHVQFVLPANFLLDSLMCKGTPIHLTFRPLGIDEDMTIRSVRHAGGYRQPKTTTITGKLYGEF